MPSPDGSYVAFTADNDSEIWLMGSDGEAPRRVIAGSSGSIFPFVLWSPDGKEVLYQRVTALKRPSKSNPNEELEENYRWEYECTDTKSGKRIFFVNDFRFDSAAVTAEGRMLFVRWGLPGDRHSYMLQEASVDPNPGALLSTPHTLSSFHKAKASGVSVSKDGSEIAVVVEQAQPDVYVATLRQPGPTLDAIRRLTFDTNDDYPHAWTVDSKSVIFESNREGTFRIYKQ